MGILDAVKSLFGRGKHAEERARRNEELVRQAFKARCAHFKSLLSANKQALAAMAEIEEALQDERHFGMSFVRANCTTIITGVFNMVRHLNALSGDAHKELFDRLKDIQHNIGELTSPKTDMVSGPLVLGLEEVGFSMAHEVGAKMAGLGEARRRLGQNIPRGFVVTASGYHRFIEANNIQEEIYRRMQVTDLSGLDGVFALSSSLQKLIMSSPVPEDLADAILSTYDSLFPEELHVGLAVRSSAIGEDALGSSFAGQYRSELNVPRDMLLDTYKEVVASKYGVTAMSYRINRGIPDDEVPMCVGCLEMIAAEAGGVAYSADPLHREECVLINAVPGLPRAVVDGSVEVDVFRVAREEPYDILSREVEIQRSRLACDAEEGVVHIPLSEEEGARPALTDDQIRQVALETLKAEEFYGIPQDMEWAFDADGRLVILQTRGLPGHDESAEAFPLPPGATMVLEGGVSSSAGVGAGEVFIVRRDADMLAFPKGAVLVVEQAHARWAPILGRAAAVVAELGGTAGHLASVAREYGVPALFGIKGALAAVENGMLVTVDADSRRILHGRVEEVLARKKEERVSFAGSPVYAVLVKAADYIVPLNLLDPDAPSFTPAHCKTLHDITRFCHEKAVEEMFRMDESLFSERCGKQLKYRGSKLQYFVVNVENGFCRPIVGRYVELADICCPPMHALWQGMIAIPWAGPVGTSARSFFAVVAESTTNRDLEITSASTRLMRNYFMVDREYCNLQASFGYHFCTVEAQAGAEEQENYVNFHFKGGAANLARRVLRVHALSDVLVENGFIVEVREDSLSARAEELLASEVLELLAILGYLIIHTRQMDAGLSGQDSRAAFADALRKGIAQVLKQYTVLEP